MSFKSIQDRSRKQEPEIDGSGCIANGCPLPGSVSHDGSRFMCSHHAFVESDKWQSITRELRSHDWLRGLIGDLRAEKMHRDWREYATKFWEAAEPAMIPGAEETRVMYLYRLHVSLSHRVGARDSEPGILKPAGADLPKRSGTLGAMLDFASATHTKPASHWAKGKHSRTAGPANHPRRWQPRAMLCSADIPMARCRAGPSGGLRGRSRQAKWCRRLRDDGQRTAGKSGEGCWD